MIDPRREAVLIADRGTGTFSDETWKVAAHRTRPGGGTVDITFVDGPRVFPYGSGRVRILRDPEPVPVSEGGRVLARHRVPAPEG